MTNEQIYRDLKQRPFGYLVAEDTDWPKPFPNYAINLEDPWAIKAIVLGADPSHRMPEKLEYVFKLECNDAYNPYFNLIERNLTAIGLSKNNIYVQNVCRNFFSGDTYQHKKNWLDVAKYWIPLLLEELKPIPITVPVLMTTEIIYHALASQPYMTAKAFYRREFPLPLSPDSNALNRPLIPFYRSPNYRLDTGRWDDYVLYLKEILGT